MMKRILFKTLVFTLVLILSGSEWQNASVPKSKSKNPRNIILFIGDGMGVAQLYAGMTVSDHKFSLERFPYSGFSKTYSADNYVTDSGAGGTAIACGVKTNNGMIGVKPDGSSVKSIMEYAHQNGLATGIISTSTVTHATPASFVAHNSGRDNYEDIAKDFLNGTIDVFIGGGEEHFRKRNDGIDLTLKLNEQGYSVVYTLDDLKKTDSEKVAGLLAMIHMQKASEGRAGALEVMTQKAIETLSRNKKGFVLMVEGSMIDWGAHEQKIDYVTSEVVDFDNAVGVASEYASKTKNTLVVVTADHETGGLVIAGGSISDHKVVAKFSGAYHSGVMVPIFSFGPGAERFSGIHENTFFLDEFLNLLRLEK